MRPFAIASAVLGFSVVTLAQAVPAQETAPVQEPPPAATPQATVTIRTERETSTVRSDADGVKGLNELRPGDRITVTVKDEDGRSRAVTATVDGAVQFRSDGAVPAISNDAVLVPSAGGETSDARPKSVTTTRTVTTAWLERGQAVEFRSFDPVSRRLTVRTDDGQHWVLVIDRAANLDFGSVTPGESVLLSWRLNRQGQPEAVMRAAPHKAIARALGRYAEAERKPDAWMRGPLQVLAVDTAAGALTVRSERVEPETLSVDDSAARALDTLAPGDLVILSLRGDRVTMITKRPEEGRETERSTRR
jgi:hypothetical protein